MSSVFLWWWLPEIEQDAHVIWGFPIYHWFQQTTIRKKLLAGQHSTSVFPIFPRARQNLSDFKIGDVCLARGDPWIGADRWPTCCSSSQRWSSQFKMNNEYFSTLCFNILLGADNGIDKSRLEIGICKRLLAFALLFARSGSSGSRIISSFCLYTLFPLTGLRGLSHSHSHNFLFPRSQRGLAFAARRPWCCFCLCSFRWLHVPSQNCQYKHIQNLSKFWMMWWDVHEPSKESPVLALDRRLFTRTSSFVQAM